MGKRCRGFAQVARWIGLAACVSAGAMGCTADRGLTNPAPAPEARAVKVKVKPAPTPPPEGSSKPVDVKQITGDGITVPATVMDVAPPKAQSDFVFAFEKPAPVR